MNFELPVAEMDDAALRATNRHLFELSSIHQSEHEFTTGSVLAIVEFPRNPGVDCNGCQFKPVYKLRIDHDKLVAIGSAKIQAMLTPRKQERIRRRHGLQQLPEGVEFVIDLTPPSEGPERADVVAALWLPRGVKLWYLAGQYTPQTTSTGDVKYKVYRRRPLDGNPVGAVLALGHDDKCCCVQDHGSDRYAAWKPDTVSGIVDDAHQAKFRQIEDYCEIRHRVNIIRLLRAINGADLLINSATRMWTLVHIAVDLEITSVVRDSVAQWFLAPPNTKFIEIFPEEAFKVALTLQIPDVLVTSFNILVNEFAIDHATTFPSPQRPKYTWAQRRRGDYGDIPMDPVEHAGIAFHERIKEKLDKLRADNALDNFGIPEWEKLKRLRLPMDVSPLASAQSLLQELDSAHQKLVNHLREMFWDHVATALLPSPGIGQPLSNLLKAQRLHYIPEDELTEMEVVQRGLNEYQRALCPFFWENLNSDFQGYRSKIYNGSTLNPVAFEYNRLLSVAFTTGGISPYVSTCGEILPSYPATPRFDLAVFLSDLTLKLKILTLDVLGSDLENEFLGAPMLMSDHIIRKLDENELKFLPIWAGGWDDGSGGVFQDAVPSTEMGPSEPGPAYHTGWTVAAETDAATVTQAASVSNLGLSDLDLSDAPRSLDVHDSISTATRIYPTGQSMASEQFAVSDSEFVDAMYREPADHQALGQSLLSYVNVASGSNSETFSAAASVSMSADGDDDDMLLSDDDTLSVGSVDGAMSEFEMVEA